MTRSLDIGATGMLAQQINVDVISNNIANMTTTGHKRQRAAFQDLIYQNIDSPGSTSSDTGTTVPAGLQLGLGVRPASVVRQYSQGGIRLTENNFDLAITGEEGFFQIQLPSGETAYTRDGTFQMNENGELVTVDGFLMEPSITIPDDAISIDINGEGQVIVKSAGQAASQQAGQIQLARFVNPAGLEAVGDNLLLETDASGSPTTGNPGQDEFARIKQGALEQSNVNVVEEITELIKAQRAYEMNSNIVSTSDEMLQTITQLR